MIEKTSERDEGVYIFLILFKYHIYHLVLPFRGYRRYLLVSQKTKYVQFSLIFKFRICIVYDPSYLGKIINRCVYDFDHSCIYVFINHSWNLVFFSLHSENIQT